MQIKLKLTTWISVVLAIFLASCSTEELPPVSSFTASQGTRIEVIRLVIENVPGAEYYEFERKNPATNQWESIYTGESLLTDDSGWLLPNEKLLPARQYEYRVRAHSYETGYGDWSETVTGYIFSPAPEIISMDYVEIDGSPDYTVNFIINDSLPDGIGNIRSRGIVIYRTHNSSFYSFQSMRVDGSNISSLISGTGQVGYDPNTSYNYKFEISYSYSYSGPSASGEFLYDGHFGEYNYTSGIISGDDITGKDDSIVTIDYTVTDYGEINSSASGAKGNSVMCADSSTLYLGYIDDYGVTTGHPVLMKNEGSSGQVPEEHCLWIFLTITRLQNLTLRYLRGLFTWQL